MKIKITTIREIIDTDFDSLMESLNNVGIPIDGKQLKNTGSWSWESDKGYTRAKTTYEILEESNGKS